MARRFILALSGASGSIYARLALKALLEDKSIDQIAVIISDTARQVMELENQTLDLSDQRIKIYKNTDFTAPCASGSSPYQAMIIIPCSSGTMGRIASGVCTDLISRTADVMLKERRSLILALRETPLSLVHINNMSLLSQCGATIMPLSPAFYTPAQSLEEICDELARRIVRSAGAKVEHYHWGE